MESVQFVPILVMLNFKRIQDITEVLTRCQVLRGAGIPGINMDLTPSKMRTRKRFWDRSVDAGENYSLNRRHFEIVPVCQKNLADKLDWKRTTEGKCLAFV